MKRHAAARAYIFAFASSAASAASSYSREDAKTAASVSRERCIAAPNRAAAAGTDAYLKKSMADIELDIVATRGEA